MRNRNVEGARQAAAAVNALDVDAFAALADPGVEGASSVTGPFGTIYRGHEGICTYFRDLEDAFQDGFRIEPEALFDLGEHTLAFYLLHGRGGQSGAQVSMRVAVVTRWRNGLMIYFRGYSHRAEALRDLGVTEDELESVDP
jgi:ketosteroid isomerase-like protein